MKSSVLIITIFCATAVFAAQPNDVVLPLSASPQLLIPAAGNVAGANGTFFRSDITLVNLASHDQNIKLQWLPQGASATSSMTITIAAQRALRSADFVAEVLAQSGLGAIVINGVTSAGAADPTALLWASSRIWTNQPGTNGTTSQSLPAVPLNALFSGSSAALFALSSVNVPSNFRVNVGIVNLNATTHTYAISQSGSGSVNLVIIPAMSMAQISLGSGLSATQEVLIQDVTTGGAAPNSWIVYGSTVDNITGDAWSELGVPGQ